MQKGMPFQRGQSTLATCVECAEQATRSCALCRTPLCKRHQHQIQREETNDTTVVMLCAACEMLKVGCSLEEFCAYIAWYNPGWALA